MMNTMKLDMTPAIGTQGEPKIRAFLTIGTSFFNHWNGNDHWKMAEVNCPLSFQIDFIG